MRHYRQWRQSKRARWYWKTRNAAIAEPLRKEVKKDNETGWPVTFEKLKEVKCVETRIEEKTFTHEQAEEIIEELKEKKIISKEGKIKDTMKAQLKAGKLD